MLVEGVHQIVQQNQDPTRWPGRPDMGGIMLTEWRYAPHDIVLLFDGGDGA